MEGKDLNKLIGIPYEKKDCWGIVVEFYKLFLGIELKNYYETIPKSRDDAKEIVYSSMSDFIKVEDSEEKKFGDIILIKLYGVECHVGVFVESDLMIHTTVHSGCVMERFTRWKHLIVGFYRAVNK